MLSAITNLGLFAVINILLVALVRTDTHVDPNASAYYTLRVFIWTNAIAAVATAIAAPFVLSAFERMQHRLTRQNKELRSLHAIDTAISAELNLATILEVAVRNATVTADGEFGALWLFADHERTVIDADAFYNVPPALRALVKEAVVDRNSEDPTYFDNARRRRDLDSTWTGDHTAGALKLRNFVTVPIKHQDRAVGVMMVANRGEVPGQPLGFTTEDEDLLTAIATTIAVAVQNSRLYKETELRGAMLRSLVARIGDAVSASSDASLLMQVLADEAKRILGCSRVAVYEFDDAQEAFLPLAASDDTSGGRSAIDLFFRQPLNMDIILPPEADNPAANHYYDNLRATLGLSTDIGQFLNRPGFLFVLRSREQHCIGLLCMLDSAHRPLSEDTWAFAHALSAQAAVALENARLSERTHALLAQARALQDATNKIAAELDINRVLEGVMDSARSVLTADGYAIWDYDAESDQWEKRASYGISFGVEPPESAGGIPREIEALQYVIREQSPLVISNTAHAPLASSLSLSPRQIDATWQMEQGLQQPWRDGEPAIAPLPSREGARHAVRALLALPLVYRGKSTGVMALYYRSPHTFIPDEVGLAQSFAHQAANALQNARMFAELNALYKREKRIAGELQRSLLPPIPPEVGKFNIAYRYQAGLDEAAVGGDFLDLFFLGPHTMGLVIADVSGKGLPAAVQTAMIKYTLRAFAGEIPKNPAEVLQRVNNVLCNRSTAIQGFVTLFYGVLDAQNGVLTYANAGHELPLLCDGETGWVCGLPVADGIALGCMPDMDFQNRTVILDPGSMLLMYTDGLTEARNSENEFLGLDGLRRFMSCGSGEAETAIQLIYDAVEDYAGDSLRDDVAMLLVERKSE
jgi:serine phosphatase RsbU (regulator of sigma subunit)